jgi:hypothetical protein
MSWNPDPYDNGTPKYSTAQDIYDALEELTQSEEIGMLSEVAPDVSWDNQDYIYFEKGDDLKERVDAATGYGRSLSLMDLAIFQLEGNNSIWNAHDFVFEALADSDLAKRIGFKKLFVEHLLHGDKSDYAKIAEAFFEKLHELNRFGLHANIGAFGRAMKEICGDSCDDDPRESPYPAFSEALYNRISRLDLSNEKILVAECRALLTSYDDFIFGLKMNQGICEELQRKIAELQFAFDQKVAQLREAAERAGLLAALDAELQQFAQPEDILEIDGAIALDATEILREEAIINEQII